MTRGLKTTIAQAIAMSPTQIKGEYKGTSSHTLGSADMLNLKVSGGFTWYRDDAIWESVEAVQNTLDWTRLDGIFSAANTAGLNVLLIVDYAPAWAGGIHAPDPTEYAAFAVKCVNRYRNFGKKLALEFWNEPYMPNPYIDPADYAAVVRAAGTAVKALGYGIKCGANVDNVNFQMGGTPYFHDMLTSDPTVGNVLDFWSTHAYAGVCGPYDTDVECTTLSQNYRFDRIPVAQAKAQSFGSYIPWWVTEVGWSTCTDPLDGVSEAVQAAYLSQAITRARTEWGVEKVFLYTGDKDTAPDNKESRYGLLRSNGTNKPCLAMVKGV